MPQKPASPSFDRELLSATKRGDRPAAIAAIERGARPGCRNHENRTPLMLAAERRSLDLAILLLPLSDASAKDKGGWTALMSASRALSLPIVELILRDAPDSGSPRATNSGGLNALTMACIGGFDQGVLALLPFGGADARTVKGLDPLMLCALGGHIGCARLLLPSSDLGRRDLAGRDAAAIADEKGHAAIALLIRSERALRERLEIELSAGASKGPEAAPPRL